MSALQQAPPPLRDAVLKARPARSTWSATTAATPSCWWWPRNRPASAISACRKCRKRITTTLRNRKEQLLRAAYLSAVRNDAAVVNYIATRLVEGQGKLPASVMPAAPGTR